MVILNIEKVDETKKINLNQPLQNTLKKSVILEMNIFVF